MVDGGGALRVASLLSQTCFEGPSRLTRDRESLVPDAYHSSDRIGSHWCHWITHAVRYTWVDQRCSNLTQVLFGARTTLVV
jgi:hypothetical protein